MEQKEYWELYITQGKNKVWLKTYESKKECLNLMFKIIDLLRGEKGYVRECVHDDCESIFDYGSHTTFFEIKRVVK